jgi:hypothetical protein
MACITVNGFEPLTGNPYFVDYTAQPLIDSQVVDRPTREI